MKKTNANPVTTAPCGCLVLDDEWCRTCGGCGGRGVEWSGCCRCVGGPMLQPGPRPALVREGGPGRTVTPEELSVV